MNDQDLKQFLNSNSKVPERPAEEWYSILSKIEANKGGSLLKKIKVKELSFGITALAIFALVSFNIIGPYHSKKENAELHAIETFLIEDSYFSEPEGRYSWVRDF